MQDFNRVMFSGRLTRDPELKYTAAGTAVTGLSMAINEQQRDKQGTVKQHATYVDVSVWDKTAEACVNSLRKGSPVMVDGLLTMDRWQGKDSKWHTKLRVKAYRVMFLDTSKAEAVEPQKEPEPAEPPEQQSLPTDNLDDDNMPF